MSAPQHLFPIWGVLLLTVGLVLPACGPDEPTGPDPAASVPPTETPSPFFEPDAPASTEPPAPAVPAEPVRAIDFVDGLAAGIAAAKNPDDLIFVYIGRHSPT